MSTIAHPADHDSTGNHHHSHVGPVPPVSEGTSQQSTAHNHDHAHGSFGLIGVVLLVLAAIELRSGTSTGNASIASLGSHTLVDAAFPILAAFVGKVAAMAAARGFYGRRYPRLIHWLGCQLSVYTGLFLAAANIVLIGVLPLLLAPTALSETDALAGVVIGAIDLVIKVWIVRRLSQAAHLELTFRMLVRTSRSLAGDQAALIEHFRLDAEAALATVIGSALSGVSGDLKWIIAAVGFILARSVQETLPQIVDLARQRHPSPLHH